MESADGTVVSIAVDADSMVELEVDLVSMGRLGQTFLLFWPRDRSETLQSGPGMLLDRFSSQTVDSGPNSGQIRCFGSN